MVEAFRKHQKTTNLGRFNRYDLEVKWKNYEEKDNSDEPLANLYSDVPEMVEKYFFEKGLKVVPKDPAKPEYFELVRITDQDRKDYLEKQARASSSQVSQSAADTTCAKVVVKPEPCVPKVESKKSSLRQTPKNAKQ